MIWGWTSTFSMPDGLRQLAFLDAVESIRDDPATYWRLIDSRIEAVASQRERLLGSLAVPCTPADGWPMT